MAPAEPIHQFLEVEELSLDVFLIIYPFQLNTRCSAHYFQSSTGDSHK